MTIEELKDNKVYEINHETLGVFRIKYHHQDNDFIYGLIEYMNINMSMLKYKIGDIKSVLKKCIITIKPYENKILN